MNDRDLIADAADLIAGSDGLIITAGAGMGVDSGLPDFRSAGGFWNAYPALARARMQFADIARPVTFKHDPRLAWGFYGHRLNLYRKTRPHQGFQQLLDVAKHLKGGGFIYTSNVDGQFQKAGFPEDRIVECHGSIHHLQCQIPCNQEIWESDEFTPIVDEEHCVLTSSFPTCRECGGIARPNVLMFGDFKWVSVRIHSQITRLKTWRETVHHPVVIELGAGDYIFRVRDFGQSLDAPLIRINRTDARVDRPGHVGLQMGALDAIAAITQQLIAMSFIKQTIEPCLLSQ